MKRSRSSTVLLTALLTALPAVAAHAATITWSNSAGGAWSTAANWSPPVVPGSGDVAVLPALSGAYTVTLDVNPVASQLTIDAGDPTLDMNGASIASIGTIENSGTIVNFAGPYTVAQMHNHTGGLVAGAYDGVITMGAGIYVNDGTIVVGPGAASRLSTSGGITINGSGTLKLDHTKVIDAAGLPQNTMWLTIGPDQTLRGSGIVEKKLWNNGTWVADTLDGTAGLMVHAVAYNRGTVLIQNAGKLWINSSLFQNENSGVIRSGEGGGTLDLRISEDSGATLNGNSGSVDLLRGGSIVIAGGGDLNLYAEQLYGGPVSRSGDTGVLHLTGTSLQQMSIEAGAEVLSTGWMSQQIQEHVRIDGLLRIAGQFMAGLSDTSVHDTTWFSGSGVVQLEDGILGTGSTSRVLVNEITIRGHGTINPPFQNNGTVDLDAVRLARPGFVNTGVLKIGPGGMIASGTGTLLRNSGRLELAGIARLEKSAGLDNRGGVITIDRSAFSIGNSSTYGTITGGRLEGTRGGVYQVARGGTLRDVTLGATGVLNVGANATLVAAGSRFTNLGTVNVAATGRFSTDGTTQYLQTGGATALAGGSLLSARDVQIQAGTLRGYGVVSSNLVSRGTVAPDAGATPLRISGSFTQLTGGTLQCSIAGPEASQTSHFEVNGTATLAGALAPVLVGGYVPSAGQSFPVFTYGALTGGFDPLSRAAGSENLATSFTPFFQDGAMTLVAGGTTAVGDEPSVIGTLRFFGRTTTTGASFVLQLPYAAALEGRVYDAAGREVAKLADGVMPAGAHTFTLGRTANGNLASGVYFARMSIAHGGVSDVRTARAVVLR